VVGRHTPLASDAESIAPPELEPAEEPELELPEPELPELPEPPESREPPDPPELEAEVPESLELEALASASCTAFSWVEPSDDPHAIQDDAAMAQSGETDADVRRIPTSLP
jgi:hypothetical protein